MLNNNDRSAKQIGLDAVNKFIDEFKKPMPGDDYTVIKTSDGKYAFIKPDGTFAFNKWFSVASDFFNGRAYVDYGRWETVPEGERSYGFMDINGKLHGNMGDGYQCDRKVVYDEGEMYHFEDRNGNQIGGKYRINYNMCEAFIDDFAVVEKNYCHYAIIDKNGVEIPQENDDEVLSRGNLGCGYYLTGDISKMRGIKLKDARTGITLDRFQDYDDVKDGFWRIASGVRFVLSRFSKKQIPSYGLNWANYKEVSKRCGIRLFGNYWFLGSSNIKVTKENDGYHSKSEFGEYITKFPPIKALDDNYLLCAHNNAVYVYDKRTNTYGKTCDRDEVEDLIRKKNAKIGYQKFFNSMKALANFKKLNPESDVTIAVTSDTILCYPICRGENGSYYELQPVLLKFPQIAKYITYNDDNYYVMYNGQRKGIKEALTDLRAKAFGKKLEEMFDEEELSSGRGK